LWEVLGQRLLNVAADFAPSFSPLLRLCNTLPYAFVPSSLFCFRLDDVLFAGHFEQIRLGLSFLTFAYQTFFCPLVCSRFVPLVLRRVFRHVMVELVFPSNTRLYSFFRSSNIPDRAVSLRLYLISAVF